MNVIRDVAAERGQLLLDLRRVAVARDAVGVDVLIDGHEVGLVSGAAAGAGHAGLGVDDDVGDQAGARQRRQRQDRGGRVAARVGDQLGAGDLVAVELRQPVDRVGDQLRLRVRLVPLLVGRRRRAGGSRR